MPKDAPGPTRITVSEPAEDVGSLIQPFNPDEYEPRELVPDTAAGVGGSATLTTAAPVARYSGGSFLASEVPNSRVPAPMEPKPQFQTLEASAVKEPTKPPTNAGTVTQIRRPQERGTGGRPAGRGASQRSSAKSGDSGSDDGPLPPRETPAEQVARRFRELDEFVERHGLDYWDRHTAPSNAQLELGEAA
jgi:hypothetical protein